MYEICWLIKPSSIKNLRNNQVRIRNRVLISWFLWFICFFIVWFLLFYPPNRFCCVRTDFWVLSSMIISEYQNTMFFFLSRLSSRLYSLVSGFNRVLLYVNFDWMNDNQKANQTQRFFFFSIFLNRPKVFYFIVSDCLFSYDIMWILMRGKELTTLGTISYWISFCV